MATTAVGKNLLGNVGSCSGTVACTDVCCFPVHVRKSPYM
jgi:hypothetical protein